MAKINTIDKINSKMEITEAEISDFRQIPKGKKIEKYEESKIYGGLRQKR